MSIRLKRLDLNTVGVPNKLDTIGQELAEKPHNKSQLMRDYSLPLDAVIKLKVDGKLIPWSLLPKYDRVDIEVLRPHQHGKPKVSKYTPCDSLFRETVRRLETRVGLLEEASTPEVMAVKTDRDVEILTKQVSFLSRRMTEAEEADWIKNPSHTNL